MLHHLVMHRSTDVPFNVQFREVEEGPSLELNFIDRERIDRERRAELYPKSDCNLDRRVLRKFFVTIARNVA